MYETRPFSERQSLPDDTLKCELQQVGCRSRSWSSCPPLAGKLQHVRSSFIRRYPANAGGGACTNLNLSPYSRFLPLFSKRSLHRGKPGGGVLNSTAGTQLRRAAIPGLKPGPPCGPSGRRPLLNTCPCDNRPHASHFTHHASLITPHVSRITLHASRITLHALRLPRRSSSVLVNPSSSRPVAGSGMSLKDEIVFSSACVNAVS